MKPRPCVKTMLCDHPRTEAPKNYPPRDSRCQGRDGAVDDAKYNGIRENLGDKPIFVVGESVNMMDVSPKQHQPVDKDASCDEQRTDHRRSLQWLRMAESHGRKNTEYDWRGNVASNCVAGEAPRNDRKKRCECEQRRSAKLHCDY